MDILHYLSLILSWPISGLAGMILLHRSLYKNQSNRELDFESLLAGIIGGYIALLLVCLDVVLALILDSKVHRPILGILNKPLTKR